MLKDGVGYAKMMEYTVLTSSLAGGLGIRRAVFDMLYENAKRSGVNLL